MAAPLMFLLEQIPQAAAAAPAGHVSEIVGYIILAVGSLKGLDHAVPWILRRYGNGDGRDDRGSGRGRDLAAEIGRCADNLKDASVELRSIAGQLGPMSVKVDELIDRARKAPGGW